MGGYQIPVDFVSEQRVDVLIADRFARAIEDCIAQPAHARHQLDAEKPTQSEDWLALALGISVKRIGLNRRAVLHQRIEDVDRLPHPAGDEAGEQGDVGIGDVVVCDPTVAAIADVRGSDEIILAELDVRTIGDRCPATAPVTGQREAGVLVDDVNHCRLKFVGIDVLRVDPTQRLSCRDLWGMSSGLIWPEIAAVAEHRENISLNGVGKFRIGAGWWSEVAGVASPVLGMLENIKEMPLRHPRSNFLLKFDQPFRLDARRQLLQVGCSVFIDAQFTVGRKSCVNLGSVARQFGLECGSKIHAALGNAESCAVSREAWFAFRPRQELGAVVGEFLSADDVAIAGLQSISKVNENADLKCTSVKHKRLRSALDDKILPALRGKAKINRVRQFIAACMAMLAHDSHCVQQTAILCRRLDVQQIDKPKQQAAMSGVNWPEQREIVAAVPGG